MTDIWRISIEEDKARKDFAVNSASRISRTTLPAVKSKGKPARRKTEKGYLKGIEGTSFWQEGLISGLNENCYS